LNDLMMISATHRLRPSPAVTIADSGKADATSPEARF
jgi:hypothetical protein